MKEVLRDTNEQWKRFSRVQKLAAFTANLLTVSRPLIASIVAKRGLDKNHEWELKDTALLGAGYLTDLEGNIARAAQAQTKLGGVLDPLADKLATNSQEFVLCLRGEESYARFGLRLARDIGISALRKATTERTDGQASVSAGVSGKINTAFRKGTILFATSPLGEAHPKTRRALQIASTAATIASGVITAKKLYSQLKQKR